VDKGDIKQSPTYSAHKPWLEEHCEECHTRTLKLGNRDSDLCLKCHANKTAEHENMHGPVAVGACLWCHDPHNSAYASLLKAPAREVCSQCHATATLNAERVPAHAQADRSCLECHDGHGGKERFFLRASGEAH
jgi:predicted CXXCH cytochrome family protein